MTAFNLQDELAVEVERILADMLFKNVQGENAKVRAYPQELPKRIQEVKPEEIMPREWQEDPYPFVVVRIDSGNLKTAQDTQQIKTDLVFGIYDKDFACQGHRGIMNMVHKIAERFTRNPVLNDRYRLSDDAGISWTLDEEDRYPYYFGGMEMVWDTFFVTREEDRYA